MSSKKDAFCRTIEAQTGRLVVVLKDNTVIIPTTVGQTKEYGIQEFLFDYYHGKDHPSVNRFMTFLKTANKNAAKRLNGKLGFVNKCLEKEAEIYILNPESGRGSDRLFEIRLMVDYDHIKKEADIKKNSFFSKKPRT